VIILSIVSGSTVYRPDVDQQWSPRRALLAYPIILVVAGLLLGGRHFIYYLAAMLLFSAFLQYATSVLLWRSDVMNSTKLELLRDVWVVLVASAFAVWITVSDWRKLLGELHIRIDEYRQSQAHLTYLSQHDALTELPNRSFGRQLMEAAIGRARTTGSHVALMFVDLDNFKFINDSVGHAAGDEFLQQIASRLRSAVRETDVVMRQSGDEFLVGLLDVPDIQAASKAANEVLEHLGCLLASRAPSCRAPVPLEWPCTPGTGTIPTPCCGMRTWLCTRPSRRAAILPFL